VNLCTASGLVLDASRNDPQNQNEFRGMDLAQQREKGCFPLRTVYTNVIADPKLKAKVEEHVEEKSSWFRLRTNVRIGTAEFVLYSLMYREPTNRIRTVQRSFGSE
jgi:type II secretory pathway component PulK